VSEEHQSLIPTLFPRGRDHQLDSVLDLLGFVSRPRPLTEALDKLPERIAEIFEADVCSIYLREGDGVVLRGNVGFPEDALDDVRLETGQGLTGLAVDYGRPVALETAPAHAAYVHFPDLGEERYPIFLAIPIAGEHRPLGALVLQRADGNAFSVDDVKLGAALTSPIAQVIERAALIEAIEDSQSNEREKRGNRRVTLAGRRSYPGRAVGKLALLRRPDHQQDERSNGAALLEQATAKLSALVEEQKALAQERHIEASVLDDVMLMLQDTRARQRALDRNREGEPMSRALCAVGAEATRAAARSQDAFTVERAATLADVYEALAMLVDDELIDIPRDAVLATERAGLCELMAALRYRPAALVVREQLTHRLARFIVRALALPAVSDVRGLYRWTEEADLLVVDGDHGLVRVNPSQAEVAMIREHRRQGGPKDPANFAESPQR
jgi:phosphotransferase system enzyme I (PtsP)